MSFLEEEPQGDKTTQWLGGILGPLPFAIYGLLCIVNRVGAVPAGRGGNGSIVLAGLDAVVLGVMCFSLATLLHFHFYWGLSEKTNLKENYDYGKLVSLVILIGSLGWVTWCILRGFMELY